MTDYELELIKKIVRRSSPGVYELRDLYGSQWPCVDRPKRHGIAFRKSVANGEIPGLARVPKQSKIIGLTL